MSYSFERIALIGTGSLGTVLGAYLSAAGLKPDLIDANPTLVDALNKNGARVTGCADFSVPVRSLLPKEMQGEYDLFLYLAKQTAHEACLPVMKAHSHSDTIVCAFQNGLPEEAVYSYYDRAHVVGAIVGWAANLIAPGVSELNEKEDIRCFHISMNGGNIPEILNPVRAVLQKMCRTEITGNLPGMRWSKLTVNATLSGVSLISGMTFGQEVHDPLAARIIANIGRETVTVAKAAGIDIERYSAILDPVPFFSFNTPEEEKLVTEAVGTLAPEDYSAIASMLQDIRRGCRRIEISHINGAVSRTASLYGLETPFNDRLIGIAEGIVRGEISPSVNNLSLFVPMFDKEKREKSAD